MMINKILIWLKNLHLAEKGIANQFYLQQAENKMSDENNEVPCPICQNRALDKWKYFRPFFCSKRLPVNRFYEWGYWRKSDSKVILLLILQWSKCGVTNGALNTEINR